jgi:hypothetical protein
MRGEIQPRLAIQNMSFLSKLPIKDVGLALAVFLGIHSLWVLAAELVRPTFPVQSVFPVRIPSQDINSKRIAAAMAASIGFVRGDLWSDRVLVDAANVLGDQATPTNALSPDAAEAVTAAAQRALSSRPIDSRTWLVLAALSSNHGDDRAIQQLKMSYYTGPNDRAVIGYRLKLATDFHALDDADLREAARREIRTILLRASDLRAVIAAAYRTAQPKEREFIEMTVAATDPRFAAKLHSEQ